MVVVVIMVVMVMVVVVVVVTDGGGGDDYDAFCRSENSELHHSREVGKREQQDLSLENEKLIKKLEILAKYGPSATLSITTVIL